MDTPVPFDMGLFLNSDPPLAVPQRGPMDVYRISPEYHPGALVKGQAFGVTPAGRKDDTGKLDITLFFDDLPNAIEKVTEVLQWATTHKKPEPYRRGSWQHVDDFQRRYRAAQLRHELSLAKQKIAGAKDHSAVDAETQIMELAHIATDALFRLEMATRALKEQRNPFAANAGDSANAR